MGELLAAVTLTEVMIPHPEGGDKMCIDGFSPVTNDLYRFGAPTSYGLESMQREAQTERYTLLLSPECRKIGHTRIDRTHERTSGFQHDEIDGRETSTRVQLGSVVQTTS